MNIPPKKKTTCESKGIQNLWNVNDVSSGHRNATHIPYFWTFKDALQIAREKSVNGLNAKTTYDEVNKESGEHDIRTHKLLSCETQGNGMTRPELSEKMISSNNTAAFQSSSNNL